MSISRVIAGLIFSSAVFFHAPLRLHAEKAVAHIQGTAPKSKITGVVRLEDTPAGLKVTADLANIPAGNHGFHIHEFGDCKDLGKAAGEHYNPAGHPHGDAVKSDPESVHPGDMGNITADEKGRAQLEVFLPKVQLSQGPYPVAGRAIILHEKPDDFSQPVGNAGGRIACAPIVIVQP